MAPARHTAQLIALALLALAGSGARANLYSCVSGDGRTIWGALPPPECADREYWEFGPDGRPLRPTPPPLTPEQRRDREEAEQRLKNEAEAKLAQKQQDRALLATYGTVEEIEAARTRDLLRLQQRIDAANQRRDELTRERKKLDNEREFYPRGNLPEALVAALSANTDMLASQEKNIADVRAEMQRVNQFYEAKARRFGELMTGVKPEMRPAGIK